MLSYLWRSGLSGPPREVDEDLALVLTAAERHAIRDARLVVWLVEHGHTLLAREVTWKDDVTFLDQLDGLLDKIDTAEAVGRRKLHDWLREIREE